MNSGDTAAGIILLIIFLAGVMIGVIVIVSRAFVREDKHIPSRGTRRITRAAVPAGWWGSATGRGQADPPEGTVLPERPGDRPGHGWGDKR